MHSDVNVPMFLLVSQSNEPLPTILLNSEIEAFSTQQLSRDMMARKLRRAIPEPYRYYTEVCKAVTVLCIRNPWTPFIIGDPVYTVFGILRSGTPVVTAKVDSSLTGSGINWYRKSRGAEVALGVCAVTLPFFNFQDDSSHQNHTEFLVAVIAVIG
jgi:hypothetical protein